MTECFTFSLNFSFHQQKKINENKKKLSFLQLFFSFLTSIFSHSGFRCGRMVRPFIYFFSPFSPPPFLPFVPFLYTHSVFLFVWCAIWALVHCWRVYAYAYCKLCCKAFCIHPVEFFFIYKKYRGIKKINGISFYKIMDFIYIYIVDLYCSNRNIYTI